MWSFFRKYRYFAIVLFCLSAVIVYLFYNALKPQETLPIYSPSMVNSELVDSTIQNKRKYHTIADFSLTNQNGKTITQEDYTNKIYVADFFFTTCLTICPIMTKNMVEIQNRTDDDILLLSHSVTPSLDSFETLTFRISATGLGYIEISPEISSVEEISLSSVVQLSIQK